jgi:trehalose synthase
VVTQKSLVEGFGLTVAEAMYKARPVVASAVGGIRDQIEDGVSGRLVADPTDHDGFGDLVADMLADPDRAVELGRRAHERVVEMFFPDRHLLRYLDVIRPLLT